MLACLLLAASLVAASSTASLAGDEKPAPKAVPAKPRPAGAGSGTMPAAAPGGGGDVLQRRRRAIAQMLEGNFAFRGPLDDGAPRLVEAKLAGPFDYTHKTSLFSSTMVTETLYCASSGVKVSIFPPAHRTALIRVLQAANGERLQATINLKYAPSECYRAEYKPFPEIEQLRTQRRRALGKAD
ncbi:MAG TPA: hypothetical protein VGO01_12500 [Bradyrhizobium sp.]|nr:hypothetical protein [Bradyrhizobium sp.]